MPWVVLCYSSAYVGSTVPCRFQLSHKVKLGFTLAFTSDWLLIFYRDAISSGFSCTGFVRLPGVERKGMMATTCCIMSPLETICQPQMWLLCRHRCSHTAHAAWKAFVFLLLYSSYPARIRSARHLHLMVAEVAHFLK